MSAKRTQAPAMRASSSYPRVVDNTPAATEATNTIASRQSGQSPCVSLPVAPGSPPPSLAPASILTPAPAISRSISCPFPTSNLSTKYSWYADAQASAAKPTANAAPAKAAKKGKKRKLDDMQQAQKDDNAPGTQPQSSKELMEPKKRGRPSTLKGNKESAGRQRRSAAKRSKLSNVVNADDFLSSSLLDIADSESQSSSLSGTAGPSTQTSSSVTADYSIPGAETALRPSTVTLPLAGYPPPIFADKDFGDKFAALCSPKP